MRFARASFAFVALLAAVASASDSAAPSDPALLRREILARLDRRIDLQAAQAHLDARLSLDEALPIPYLGLDSDPDGGGMKVTAVYALTGAEKAGLKKGDLLVAIDGERTDSKSSLARAIRLRSVGSKVTLHVKRDGKDFELPATFGARPEEDEDEEEQFPDLVGAAPPVSAPFRADFEKETVGAAPSRFDFALGGHGEPGRWLITELDHQRALRQDSADTTGIRFPLALAQGFEASDVVGRVRFRYAGGRVDKAAGIVLRYQDSFDYYVARANAAEGDLRIFRVANGTRRTLPSGQAKGATDDDAWHTLEFRAEGSKLTATLDGKVTVTAYDSWFLRGRAGLWTKSDSQSEFDDVDFEATR